MKTLIRTELFNSSPAEVFHALDDLGVTGTHMTNSSAMMMGSKLHLEYLTPHHTGLGSTYRWTGKMMGLRMDFTVKVTMWIDGKEKIWETIGETELIIYSWYRMHLEVSAAEAGTRAELSISYEKPQRFLNRILSFLFAKWYCRWCLRKMLGDARQALQNHEKEKSIV